MKDLRVDLASFQGPLDLLLYLVQQEEVDIYEVPIARIADRFLEICKADVHSLDVDQAGGRADPLRQMFGETARVARAGAIGDGDQHGLAPYQPRIRSFRSQAR